MLKRVFKIYQAKKLEHIAEANRKWSSLRIAFWFRQYMKRRFGKIDVEDYKKGKNAKIQMSMLDARQLKRTKWCMNAFAVVTNPNHVEEAG